MIRFDNLMVPHISDTFKLRCCPFIHLIGFRRFSSTKRWKTRSSCATGCLDDAGLEGTGQLGDGHDGIQHALDGRNARELSTGSFSVLDASLQTLLIDKMKKTKRKTIHQCRPQVGVSADGSGSCGQFELQLAAQNGKLGH